MASPGSSEARAPAPAPDLDRLRIDRTAGARRSRRAGRWVVAGVLALACAAAAYATIGEELLAPRVRTVRAQRVAATDGSVRTSASGYVVARRRAAISSRMSGRLERLTVDVGDRVAAGQLIGQLGCADLAAAVEEAQAQVLVQRARVESAQRDTAAAAASADTAGVRLAEFESIVREMDARLADAERTVRREQDLKPGVATSQEALDRALLDRDVAARRVDQVKAQLETARAQHRQALLLAAAAGAQVATAEAGVAQAQAALERARSVRADADIVAPFAGVVLRKEAEIGEMVAPVNSAGSTTRGALVTLADFASLEMEVDVIERDIGLVETGAPCRIVLDSRREHPYAGVVRQVVPTADRTKSTVLVKISFQALDDRVLPEMSGRVEFLKREAAAAALGRDRVFAPRAAIVERDGTRGAFEVRDSRAVFRAVRVDPGAAEKDGMVEVAEGLAGGEDLLADPPPRLADGDLVRTVAPK